MAVSLCLREGIDTERGRAAGLAHDMCKEMPEHTQREFAALYSAAEQGSSATSALMADKVVHGPAAAGFLMKEYVLVDAAVLEAVALHTVGRPGMGNLATILYCADKLESGRERLGDDYRLRCLAMPLEKMLLSVVEGVVGWMKEQGRPIAPETIFLYSSLVREADPR